MASVIGHNVEHLDDIEAIRRYAEASTEVRQIVHGYCLALFDLDIPIDNEMLARLMDAADRRHFGETRAAGENPAEPHQMRTSPLRHEAVVYYMRLGDLVKIGWSASITARKGSLNPQGVMALEFGGRPVERERHNQFVHAHQHGEWFRLDEQLADWIVERRTVFESTTGLTVEKWLDEQRRVA